MTRKLPLRWKLIFIAWSLALGVTVVLTSVLHTHARDQLLHHLEKTLEWKCDEVITVMESAEAHGVLPQFLAVETNYRSSPHTYFYQISDAQGHVIARSENLADADLAAPGTWSGGAVQMRSVPDPFLPRSRRILVRSERLEIKLPNREPGLFVIQTAASLVPFELAVERIFRAAVAVAGFSLVAIFFLLWLVTTRALRPVASMTSHASRITAKNLGERLPLSGTGDELDQLANVLNGMLDRIGKSLHHIEQFSADVAHELRTPLTRIRGELDLIQRNETSDEKKGQIEAVIEEVEQLSRLCGRLLFLARIDQHEPDARLLAESVDLDRVVSEVLEQLTPLAHDHGVELRTGATSNVQVRGSRHLLVEVLLNLVHNAIRATPTGGAVSISIEASADTVQLSVEDEGPGVPEDQREMIFQRFYRIPSDSIRRIDADGVGLGLAIVKGIAAAHHGRVELIDAPGGGSIFRVVLPAATVIRADTA